MTDPAKNTEDEDDGELTTSGEEFPFDDVLSILDEEPEGFAIYG